MTVIHSGDELIGEIIFNSDGSIDINNASNDFYFIRLRNTQWRYENKFVSFKYAQGGFGYNVDWYWEKQMRWYIAGISLENGFKRVTIIELQALEY